jgi:hypothetical protein
MTLENDDLDERDPGDEHFEQTAPTEAEIRAQQTGWMPKEKFKGDPDRWRPAEEWNQRADEFLPIARAESRKLAERLEKLERENREKDEVINASRQFMTGIEERARVAALESLKAERRDALRSGDYEAADAVDEKIDELKATPLEKPKPPEPTIPEPIKRVVDKFDEENPWFKEDPDLQDFAKSISQSLLKQGYNPNASPEMATEFFSKIRDRTMRAFPEKFPRQPSGRSAMFEGGDGQRNRQPAGRKTFENMKPEFQQACDRLIKSGMVKSRESYVKYAQDDFFR